MTTFARAIDAVESFTSPRITGEVSAVSGLSLYVKDFPAPLGTACHVLPRYAERVEAQVVGFRGGETILMPLTDMAGIAPGARVVCRDAEQRVGVGHLLLGRVIDGMGRPTDGRGELFCDDYYPVHRPAPDAMTRLRIDEPIATGVRAIDAVTTVGRGQRLGIFAGTGVGKSVLMGMIARYTAADVIVVALVGERGREVRDFLDKDLGAEGLARSVVVVSTSDQSPLLRTRACFVATAVAEYFRDQGKNVLLLMDSLTRLAMAQRQIGLTAGEPPATKGYPPSVFGMLPPLVERCGRTAGGSITGFYTVLVEGDDLTEPVADAVRGLLDGHLWLSRGLASRAHWPAIDVLESISRVMNDIVDDDHQAAARMIRRNLATYAEIEDLVNIGAYAKGTTPHFDLTIAAKPLIDAFLQQNVADGMTLADMTGRLQQLADQVRKIAREVGADKPDAAGTPVRGET
jgi:flagellum-specific ATP synthase